MSLSSFFDLKWVSPFDQKLCPYCFETFHPGDCAIVSSQKNAHVALGPPPMMGMGTAPSPPPITQPATSTPVRNVIIPRPRGLAWLSSRFWVRRTDGNAMAKQMARRECPYCEHFLPHEIDEMRNVIIGLVGGSQSGKTHYIAALINELERRAALEPFGCTRFAAIDDDVKQHYQKEYYEPLFVHKKVLPRNDENNMPLPLSYTMLFRDTESSELKRATLVLFDAPGEFMQSQSGIATKTRYILNAEAIIFLVDPMSIPQLVEQMPANQRPNSGPGFTADAFGILSDVYSLIVRHNRLQPGDRLSIPAAVAISKSDLLKWVPDIGRESSSFLQPSDGSDLFDTEVVNRYNTEVEAILRQYSSPSLLQTARLFSEVSYHAVSATGCQMHEDQMFSEVMPVRCIDPLVAVLRKLDYIAPLEPVGDDIAAPGDDDSAPNPSQAVRGEGPPPFPGRPAGGIG